MSLIKHACVPALLIAVCALGGCAGGGGPHAQADNPAANFDRDAKTPLDQYAIRVERRPQELAIAVHASGLSANQRAALAAFAANWREAGGDAPVVISTASGPAAADPQSMAAAMAAALCADGVPTSLVRYDSYDAGGLPDGPVVARFETYAAQGPDCSGQWDNYVSTNSNNATKHFGCARTANLAAMIANPRDLVQPQAMTAADGLRRATVLEKYRRGEVTATASDEHASGAISQAVR